MLNPYLLLFQKVVEFVVVIMERHTVCVWAHKLNQHSLFVVGVRVSVHNVSGAIGGTVVANKNNNIATPQITNLTLTSHT
jgi:hypothetical protein